jgi:hypothetical protein
MVAAWKLSATLIAQRKSVSHTYGGRCSFIANSFKMTYKKNEAGNLLPMTVTEGVTVNVLPNEAHEYLMTTKEVANGYGVTQYAILKNKLMLGSELIEGKHFISAITISNSGLNLPHNAILWTKRGIIRLGFAMRSERAKLFRDWAEELIISVSSGQPTVNKTLPARRNHNRLTSERLIRLLQLTHRIDDSTLRNEIVNELMGGHEHGKL